MPQNLLFIMTDQHRADCLGFMGHPVVQTPHLDCLAGQGVVFEQAFCQSPVCMASRGSLLTGRYPEAIRIRGMGLLPPQETTLPETLRRRGYVTAAFGKVHLTPEQYTHGVLHSDVPILDWRRFAGRAALAAAPDDPLKENYGFDAHVGCDDACQGNFRAWLAREAPRLLDRRPTPWSPDAPADLYESPYPSRHHQTTYIASQAADFIRRQSGERPWMTLCSFIAPHHPFEAPTDQIARYDEAAVPLPEPKGGVAAEFIPEPAAQAVGEMGRYSEAVQRRLVLHYLASISLIDAAVGLLLDALRDTRALDDTIIVFVADHGEFLGNHGLLRKPSLHYDETLHVPLMLRAPQLAPRRIGGLVELVDVYPTLLGLLGIETNPGVQGRDWSESLRNGTAIGREDVYTDMFNMDPLVVGRSFGPYMACQTLRTADWKLSIYPTAGPRYGQLFHLADDPTESRNRYGDPTCAAMREQLLWRLVSRCHQQVDPLPLRLTQY
jgi:arylsulfatase A-like enzyme